MIALELSAFSTLLAVFALWVFGMYGAAILRSRKLRERERLSQSLQPQMREAVVEYLAGSEDRERFRRFKKQSREDLEQALLSFQSNVGGGARDRLSDLTIDQALIHGWCEQAQSRDVVQRRGGFEKLAFVSGYEPCRRIAVEVQVAGIKDDDAEVRFSAALGLLQTGLRQQLERVFRMALSHDLLTRVLLTEELRRHAGRLCERALPELFASEDHDAIVAALDMALAWQRALPLDLSAALGSRNREVRLRALRLAPMVPLNEQTERAILDSVAKRDPELSLAATQAAGCLRIEAAIPALTDSIRRDNPELARAAADALAEMTTHGWKVLEELSAGPATPAAETAAGALARARRKAGL
jgi:hypothetical protein